jgi:hypothetical protein
MFDVRMCEFAGEDVGMVAKIKDKIKERRGVEAGRKKRGDTTSFDF